MKILHIILGKADKNRANGVNQVVAGLASYTAANGIFVSAIGLAKTAAFEGEVVQRDGFNVKVFTRYSKGFRVTVAQAVKSADIVHLHSTYSFLNIWVGWICDRLATPYVVTLHGGLSPARNTWRNKLQKYVFHKTLQKSHLERAALIHALTEEESTDVFEKICPKAMTIIPNGIDLQEYPPLQMYVRPTSPLKIGYIGRISREKNLEALCEAFSKINFGKTMQLLLAGPDSAYGEKIADRWSSCGVVLVGSKFGIDKLEFLRSLDLYVHPSKTDVFSISAMEALAYGVPLVLSRTSDASHFAETGAFIMCEPTAFGIQRALQKALSSQTIWPLMVGRGRELIERRMNWSVATTDLIECYRSVLKEVK